MCTVKKSCQFIQHFVYWHSKPVKIINNNHRNKSVVITNNVVNCWKLWFSIVKKLFAWIRCSMWGQWTPPEDVAASVACRILSVHNNLWLDVFYDVYYCFPKIFPVFTDYFDLSRYYLPLDALFIVLSVQWNRLNGRFYKFKFCYQFFDHVYYKVFLVFIKIFRFTLLWRYL